DHWEVLRGQGEYFDPQLLSPDGVEIAEGYVTDVLTERGMAWVDSLEGEEPWCLLIYHKAPHRNWQPDEAHAGLHSDPIPLPATFEDDYATRSSAAHMAALRVVDHLTTNDFKVDPPPDLSREELARWKYQRYMEDYLDCVAAIDDSVGRVTSWLQERGDLDDTMMMYSSDQGFFLGDHGWFDKRFIYEESIRMPLLVSYPRRIEPGPPMRQLVSNVDFARTLLEAAGAEPHEDMQGLSFFPQLCGSTAETQDAIYYRYYENDDVEAHVLAHYGLRTERFKLVYFYNDGMGHPGSSTRRFVPEWELYDLRADPHELHNRAHDPAYAEVRRELTRRLHELRTELGDVPHPDQAPLPPSRAGPMARATRRTRPAALPPHGPDRATAPHAVVHGGVGTEHGTAQEYDAFTSAAPEALRDRIAAVPGNHETRWDATAEQLRHERIGEEVRVVDADGIRVILADTTTYQQ